MNTKKILASLLAIAAACTMSFAAMAVEEPEDAPELEAVLFEVSEDGWYAEADTDWYTEGETEYTIDTAAELAGLAKLVNEGTDSFAGKTVKLTANIDLEQGDWTSIGTAANPFLGTFDGNGKTISNLWGAANANGLFGYTSSGNRADNTGVEATIKNFTIDGAVITDNEQVHNGAGAVVGCGNMHTTIEDVTVKGEIIITGQRSGGILGYAYSSAVIDNCHVDGASEENDSTIQALNWACGGIMGFGAPSDGNVQITNCSVKNIAVEAVNHYCAGGILGVGGSGKVENVSVENVKCSIAYGENIFYVSGGPTATGNVEIFDVTAEVNGEVVDVTEESLENVVTYVAKIGSNKYTTLKEAIYDAAEGDTIILGGTIEEGSIKLPAVIRNLTIDGQNTAVVKNTVINGPGGSTVDYRDLTIKNTTFENSRFVIGGSLSKDVIYKNITFDNNKFLNIVDNASHGAVHMQLAGEDNEYVENFTFTNNVIDGVSGSGNGVMIKQAKGTLIFDNNTFNNIANNAIQLMYAKPEIEDIIVSNNTFSEIGGSVLNLYGTNILTLEDNNTFNLREGQKAIGYFTSVAKIGNKQFTSFEGAIAAADENEVIVILPGTYEEVITVNKSVVLTGNPNYGEDTALASENEKPVIVIKNVTNGGVKYEAPAVVFDNLVFEVAEDAEGKGWNVSALGYYYEDVKNREGLVVQNCDFINKSEIAMSAIAANLSSYTIKDNTFKNFANIVHSYVDNGALGTVVIDGNTFENVDNIASVYWGVANDAATIAVTDNTSTDGSTARISIDDFGKTKTEPVTAIPSITVSGNDAEVVLLNMDKTNTYTVDEGLVYSYESEAVLRSMDGKLPDGTVYVNYGTPEQKMFIVVDGFVKKEAESVELVFVPNTTYDAKALENSVWDLVLIASNAEIINRLNSADFTFEIATDGKDAMAYEIIATNDEIAINNVNNDANRYEFHYEDKDADVDTDTALRIKLGTVKFTGYGAFTFNVVANETNAVHATTFVDNIVDSFTAADNSLVFNNAAENADNDTDFGTIDSEITVPTKALTINIDFPNSVENNAVAYQQMKVVVSGGELEAPLTIDLGTDYAISDLAVYDNKNNVTVTVADLYTITVANLLEINTAYTVEVSGAGYRTAKYTVTMTEDKTLNFWNNVKDNKVEVEEGKSTSAKNVTFLAGDIVKDSVINIYDLSAVVSYFGEIKLVEENMTQYAKYDLNRDGKIDSKDVAYVLVSWGK